MVSLQRRPASVEEQDRLVLEDGAQIYYLVRVRLLSGRPVGVNWPTNTG